MEELMKREKINIESEWSLFQVPRPDRPVSRKVFLP
jgi:hypothetical protein